MSNDPDSLKKTADYWGKQAGTWQIGDGVHWTEHIEVLKRINKLVSGTVDKDPYQYLIDFLQRRGKKLPVERCVTLGCGAGDLERGYSKYGFTKCHDAYDVAQAAIDKARSLAKAQGMNHVNYYVEDINKIQLPHNCYDIIFGVMAIHHMSNLEHIFAQAARALKQGGLLFLNEYIGPTRFQWSDRQLEVINGLLKVLPAEYRRNKEGKAKNFVTRPTIDEMVSVDPSEAIRSSDIIKVLQSHFTILERRDYGGTILHMLLDQIAFNFRPDNTNDMRVMKLLFDVEDILCSTGDIGSDFTVIIAER